MNSLKNAHILIPQKNKFRRESNRKAKFKKMALKEKINIDTTNKIFCNKKIFYLMCLLFIIQIIINIILKYFFNSKKEFKENKQNSFTKKIEYDKDFNYAEYENNIITYKMRNNANWILGGNEVNFINGLIRKHKPKNCLEIGVAHGGSSILILNAIKDIDNSILVSLDLNNNLFTDPTKKTGYKVNEFPELSKNWKLFTGEQPHKFLVQLNMKFDFVFLDTVHYTPGEIINFIELLPFLNENAIFVMHDLTTHFVTNKKLYPSNIVLYPSIYGDKVPLKGTSGNIENTGAVFLYISRKSLSGLFFIIIKFMGIYAF